MDTKTPKGMNIPVTESIITELDKNDQIKADAQEVATVINAIMSCQNKIKKKIIIESYGTFNTECEKRISLEIKIL